MCYSECDSDVIVNEVRNMGEWDNEYVVNIILNVIVNYVGVNMNVNLRETELNDWNRWNCLKMI